MITIEIGEPNLLSDNILIKYCAFVSFDYDSEIVKYLQNLSTRAYNVNNRTWEIPIQSLAKFCNAFKTKEIKVFGTYHDLSYLDNVIDIPKEYVYKTKPFDHQVEAIKYALNKPRFILADEQGLGKTKECLDTAMCNKDVNKVLIVCGVNSLKYNWLEEIHTHTNEKAVILGDRLKRDGTHKSGSFKDKMEDLDKLPKDVKFIITNIETLRSGIITEKVGKRTKRIFPIVEKLKELCEDETINMIVLDESHKCKDTSSQQGQAIMQLSAKYMISATGTPIMNNPIDSYFPLKWLGYETHSLYMFKQHYCVMGGFKNQEVVGFKNMPQLRDTLSQVMLRRTKEEVLNLPDKIHKIEYVEMTPKQAKIYAEVRSDIKEHINKVYFSNNPLASLIRLRQATGYTGILSEDIKESAKLDRMVELVDELAQNNKKCIIFSNWSSVTEEAKNRLKQYNPAYITGDTPNAERMSEVDKFQTNDKCKVIIGTIGAMGTGLTLTAAQTVIFLDSPWNRALKDQAEDRAHRIGTKGTVNIITLCCINTIDVRIEDIVYKKGKISDMLIDDKGNKVSMELVEELLS